MKDNSKIILITGGARSGKSDYALHIAEESPGRKAFLATAEALDEEMSHRVKEHRKTRGPDWETVEEPIEICRALKDTQENFDVVVLDCLTLWVSNLLTRISLDEDEATGRIEEFYTLLPSLKCSLVVVTNEVGMGLVPDNRLGRSYRDLVGLANRKVGETAAEAYFMVSGMPLRLK